MYMFLFSGDTVSLESHLRSQGKPSQPSSLTKPACENRLYYVCMYIYIYIERERERSVYV